MTQTESIVHRVTFTGDNILAIRHLLAGAVDEVVPHSLDPRYFPDGYDVRQVAIIQLNSRVVHRYGVGEMIEWLVCEECHRADLLRWNLPLRAALVAQGVCFDCNFWRKFIDEPDGIRINHVHYMVKDENQSGSPSSRGHGGARFDIQLHSGQRITTTNLWYQGEIPPHFHSRLPDNASWARGEEEGSGVT